MNSEHHPSCRPSDRDLIWLCTQCGGHESAEAILDERKQLVEALTKMPEVAYQTIIEHSGVKLENLPNELQCICDDALAKVKTRQANE